LVLTYTTTRNVKFIEWEWWGSITTIAVIYCVEEFGVGQGFTWANLCINKLKWIQVDFLNKEQVFKEHGFRLDSLVYVLCSSVP